MREAPTTQERESLVDIRDVLTDPTLPKRERIIEYVRQIKNPYHFKCGDMNIVAKYPKDGAQIEDCLQGVFV